MIDFDRFKCGHYRLPENTKSGGKAYPRGRCRHCHKTIRNRMNAWRRAAEKIIRQHERSAR